LKIWDILFPGMPRPSSIYVLPDQGEVICQLRDVFDRHLVGIMVDELRTHGYVLRPGVTDEQLEDIGRTAMRRMLDHFHIRPPVAASASPQRLHVPMIGSDSGIGVASGFSASGSRIDTPRLTQSLIQATWPHRCRNLRISSAMICAWRI